MVRTLKDLLEELVARSLKAERRNLFVIDRASALCDLIERMFGERRKSSAVSRTSARTFCYNPTGSYPPCPNANIRIRWFLVTFGILVVCVVSARPRDPLLVPALSLAGRDSPVESVRVDLSDISWKELWQLNHHGDPFHLKELVKTPSPYLVIKNPFTSTADLAAGEGAFQTHCTVCHGEGGVGGPAGPALKQRQMLQGSSDWAIFKTISLGISGTAMPGSTLPATDRWRLEAYVKSLAQGPESTSDNARSPQMDSPQTRSL